ncbi:MAG: hypothetical protein WBX16_01870 [Candidatus Acidiferrales bacterium]
MNLNPQKTKLMKDISSIQRRHFDQSLSAHEIAAELKARNLQPNLSDAEVETAIAAGNWAIT